MPLFAEEDLTQALASMVSPRTRLATEADDTVEIVRRKERSLAAMELPESPLQLLAGARGRLVCRVVLVVGGNRCHASPGDRSVPPRAALRRACRCRSSGNGSMAFDGSARASGSSTGSSSSRRCSSTPTASPLDRGGFDAVIGNPPWDTLRTSPDTDHDDLAPRALTRFSRDSGCYRLQSDGHANLYQLFTERVLQLLKARGRLGLLLPSGLFSDHGCVRLRRELLERCAIDAVLSFDNRDAMFPIHRGVRFLLLTAVSGHATTDVQAVFGLHSPASLDDVPDEGPIDGAVSAPGSADPEIQRRQPRRS